MSAINQAITESKHIKEQNSCHPTLTRIPILARVLAYASKGDPERVIQHSHASGIFRETTHFEGSWDSVLEAYKQAEGKAKSSIALTALKVASWVHQTVEDSSWETPLFQALFDHFPLDDPMAENLGKYMLLHSNIESLKHLVMKRPQLRALLAEKAITTDNTECLKTLLEIPFEKQDTEKFHTSLPMHLAVKSGSKNCVKLLLEMAPETAKLRGRFDQTPLHIAIENGLIDCARLLIKHDRVTATLKDVFGRSPLHIAAGNGQTMRVEFLLEMAPEAGKIKDRFGRTPLQLAIRGHNYGCARAILGKVPDTAKIDDCFGSTPLQYASEMGDMDLLEILLEKAPETAQTIGRFERSALHMAASCGHKDCVKLLLRKAPQTASMKDVFGQTPLELAKERGHIECVQALSAADQINKEISKVSAVSPSNRFSILRFFQTRQS